MFNVIGFIHLIAMTFPALSMPAAGPSIGILIVLFVTPWAVSFGRLLTRGMSTGFNSILHIFGRSSPVQIVKKIVLRIIISMTAIHPLRSWTHESLEHEHMDSHRSTFAFAKQRARSIPTTGPTSPDTALGKDLALQLLRKSASALDNPIHRSNPASVRHLVTWISRNFKPPFLIQHPANVTLSNRRG